MVAAYLELIVAGLLHLRHCLGLTGLDNEMVDRKVCGSLVVLEVACPFDHRQISSLLAEGHRASVPTMNQVEKLD